MSHEDPAAEKGRSASRRKVSFVTTLEDLEGRVLLSASGAGFRQFRAHPALVRQQTARPRANLQAKANANARFQARAHAQLQTPRRLHMMNAMRMRNPTINIQQSVNINPTINANPTVNAAPANANATAAPTPTAGNGSSYREALAAVGAATPSAPGASSVAPPTSSTPSTPATGSGSGSVSGASSNPATNAPPSSSSSTPSSPPAQNPSNWTSIDNPPASSNPSGDTPSPPAQTTPAPSKPETPPSNSTPPESGTPTPPAPPATPAPTFPDGTILRNEQTGELGWYSGAARHLISPPVAARMGIAPAQTKTVTTNVFKAVPKGSDYFPEGMFVRNQQNGEISRYSEGAFHLVSTPVAAKLGIGVDDVATISAAQYAGVNRGSDYFAEGMLLQNQQTGEVDIYQGGQRHWISVAVAARMNLTTDALTAISPSQFNAISQGKDYFPENVYLQNQETGEIALYQGGRNRVVSSPVAAKIGLTSSQLIPASPAAYNAIDKGADYFVEGMFLQNNQSGELAQYSGGQRHWVSTPAATAINLTQAQITTIGADQFSNIPRGGDYTPPSPSATAPVPGSTA